MSDDYISRLRGELLRAGARQPKRRRRGRVTAALPKLAVAAAIVAVVVALPRIDRDERPASPGESVRVEFVVQPATETSATAVALRERLAAAGVRGAEVSETDGALVVAAPAADREAVLELAQRGRVAFYDWETSVLGPDGRPVPDDPAVTGGPNAGQSGGVSERAARALADRSGGRAVRGTGGWFVLGGAPALTEREIARASAIRTPPIDAPSVALEFTAQGRTAFTALTRAVAERGRLVAGDGVSEPGAWQHLAIVVDDRIATVPFIDPVQAPNGIDGGDGAQITGELTPGQARRLAVVLDSGPLPGELSPR